MLRVSQSSECCLTFNKMRYKLRTLLIVLALGPAVLASAWQWGVPVFVFLFWPKNPSEDMIAAVAKSVLCAIAAIFLWTLSFRLQPTPNGRS